MGKTGDAICPVSAVLNYLLVMGAGPGPLFHFKDGKLHTKARFVSQMREALQTAGVDGMSYSGHSFCSGVATAAAKAGVEDSTIKTLVIWESDAYQMYMKIPCHKSSYDWQQPKIRVHEQTVNVTGTRETWGSHKLICSSHMCMCMYH